MLIKFGFRKNLRYPLFLILLNICLDIIQYPIISSFKYTGYFILCALIFLSQFFSGLIPSLIFKIQNRKNNKKKYINGFKLLHSKEKIKKADNISRILLLLFFASYFNFTGTIVRRKYLQIKDNQKENGFFFEERLKGIQIEVSALLSYLTLNIKIYRHQKFSLITIFIFLILIIIIDAKDVESNIKYFLLSCFSNMARSFLDTIEKYLFEFNFLRPCSILLYEGLIGISLILVLLFIDNNINEEFKQSQNNAVLILLFILFLIFNAFKNMYRVLTIQYYSSMTRALAESILDPIGLLFFYFSNKKGISFNSVGLCILFLIIIAFCSLIYNDFLVLYCCGMEENTYLEINKRLYSNLNNAILNESDRDSDENDDDNAQLNKELKLKD